MSVTRHEFLHYALLALTCGVRSGFGEVAAGAALEQVELFHSGEGGYHTYRIPAIVRSRKGTLLAFCEGRRTSSGDSGDIDLLLKRSFDGGKTWSPAQLVADFGPDTIGNPAPVVDWKSGTIVLLMNSSPGNVTEREISTGTGATRKVWICRSKDDGASWSRPEEITSSVKRPEWTWYATGPGNGIQLRSGRLVVACDHKVVHTESMHSHLIYSDDGGATWSIGAMPRRRPTNRRLPNSRTGHCCSICAVIMERTAGPSPQAGTAG